MALALSDLITHEKRWHARNPVNVFIRSPSRAASNAHINLCVPGPIASIGYCWLGGLAGTWKTKRAEHADTDLLVGII